MTQATHNSSPCASLVNTSCTGTGDLSELDLAEDLAARSRAHLLTAAAAVAAPEEPQARGSKLSASSGAALDRWQSSPSEAVLGFKHRVKTGFGSTPQVLRAPLHHLDQA